MKLFTSGHWPRYHTGLEQLFFVVFPLMLAVVIVSSFLIVIIFSWKTFFVWIGTSLVIAAVAMFIDWYLDPDKKGR